MLRREINIVLVCSILANITAIITILQINVQLFLFLDQRKRQTENVAISAINDINLLSRFIKHRKRSKIGRRKYWVKPGRTSLWWENLLNGLSADEEWKINFRMSRRDFFHLADLLRPDIEADANAIRDVLTVEKKLAITLYYLKDQGSYLMTCNTFGIAMSTLSIVLKAVCRAINKRVGPAYLRLPKNEQEMLDSIQKFHLTFGLPQVFGCIDCTHIPIKQPHENCHDYFCYKMKYTLNCQAICNHNGLFINVEIKWPGSVHDARVFANSDTNQLLQQKKIPLCMKELLPGEDEVPPLILADPAYPLLTNVMKEHATCTTNEEVIFNEMLRSARNQIECAFGRLKARWRILNRPMDIKLEDLPGIIYSCFVLHNYCEIRSNNNVMNQDAIQQQVEQERQNQNCSHHGQPDQLYTYNSAQGMYIRNILTRYIKEYL